MHRHFAVPTLLALAVFSSLSKAADDTQPTRLPAQVVVAEGLFGGWSVDASNSAGMSVPASSWEAFSPMDVADALHRIPGVTVSRFNPVGAFGGGDGGAIYIRGHGSSRPGGEISLMIDGVPRFMGVFSHPLLDLLDAGLAESMTVLKSPQSVSLGNRSFAGVNLVPWQPSSSGTHGRFEAGLGDFGTRWASGRLSSSVKNADVAMGGAHRESDGHRPNADGTTDHLWARASVSATEALRFSGLFHRSESEAGDPRPIGATALPITPRYSTDADFALLRADYTRGTAAHTLKLYADRGETHWLQWDADAPPPIGAAFDTAIKFRNRGASWRSDFVATDALKLALGADTSRAGGTTQDVYPALPAGAGGPAVTQYLHESGVFTQAVHETLFGGNRRLTLNAGGRAEFHQEFENTWAAELGARWSLPTWSLHGQVSRGFNYAGAYAAVLNTRWATFLPINSWRDLPPETIRHAELGATWDPHRSVQAGVVVYVDQVSNALRFDPPPPPVRFTSIARYTTRGVEAHLHWKPVNSLRLTVAGTLTSTTPERIPNLPEWTTTAAAQWTLPQGWRVDADLIWSGAQWTQNVRSSGPLTRLDESRRATLFVAKRFSVRPQSTLEAFAGLDNVFNEASEYRPGYPMPKRNLRGGLRWEF